MYSELLTTFHGKRVVNFEDEDSWQGPDVAYRLREEYEDSVSVAERLDTLLRQDGADRLTGLIIGAWSGACTGDDAAEIVQTLADEAPRLPNLTALFLGEMTYEECEISWINQTNVTAVLGAYPILEVLRIRGGNGLSFSPIRHEGLRELAIETGGLSRSTLREIFLCEFPHLAHLELLLGEENYGFDGDVDDLQPLLSGQLFPELKFLGLMNSEIADEIAAVVVNSPIVERIDVLDLSMGNLTDEGVRSLWALPKSTKLQRVNISHHFASPNLVGQLRNRISAEVVADDPQEPEDEWRPIVHAE
jgi:hypothetical protein